MANSVRCNTQNSWAGIADKIAGTDVRKDLADKQVVALIAYLDRMGTDLCVTPEAVETTEAGDEEPAESEAVDEKTLVEYMAN